MFNIIKSYDDLHCIIVGSDASGIPRIIKSDDAGKTWKYIYNTSIIEYYTDTTLNFTNLTPRITIAKESRF